MVKPETVAWWIKQMGGICKKVRGQDRYNCTYESVKIEITPDNVKVGPTTEVNYTSLRTYSRHGLPQDWIDAEKSLIEGTDFNVNIETIKPEEDQFWFIFDINDYRKALNFARKLAEEDVWVSIRYDAEIVFRKGNEVFDSVSEFGEYIRKLLTKS